MRKLSLEDIKREVFARAGAAPTSEKVASSDINVNELANSLALSGTIDPSLDDGILYTYANMYKEAQRKAASRLGIINGRLTLR